MAKANLEEYLKTGTWNRSWDDNLGSEGELDALLETPEYALHPIANEDLRRKLCDLLGIPRGHFHPFARNAVSKLTEQGIRDGSLSLYEAALARLVIESLIVPGGASIFTGEDERKRREWVDSIRKAGRPDSAIVRGGFACIKDLAPSRVLRLAISKTALAQTSTEIRSAVSQAILGALERVSVNEPISIEAKVRLAIVRFWVVSNEGDDCEDRPDALLRDAGFDRAKISRLVESIKNEQSLSALLTAEGASINLALLNERGDFRGSADFFGFRFDVESFELLRRLASELGAVADPWAKLLYRIALASDARSSLALAELVRLGDDRGSRVRAMRFICDAQSARPQEYEPILNAEFGNASQGFAQRLFRALVAASFSLHPSEMNGMLSEVGLADWFAEGLDGYQSSARGVTPPELPAAFISAYRPEPWSRFPTLRPFAEALNTERGRLQSESDRREAENDGRMWLYDFVLRVGTLPTERYDNGNRILSDGDRGIVRQLAERHANKEPRWWAVALSFPSELRLQETWVRIFQGEAAPLEVLVRRMSEELLHSVPQNLHARAAVVAESCAQFVMDGECAPREQALQAFRNGDAAEFIEQLQGVDVELPPIRRHPRVFGRRVMIGVGVLCLLPMLLMYRVFLPRKSAPSTPEVSPIPLPLESLKPTGIWSSLKDGSYVMQVDHSQFEKFFAPVYRLDEADERFAIVTQPVAIEFVARYSKWAESEHRNGLQSTAETCLPWDTLVVRLPNAAEQSQLLQRNSSNHTIWLQPSSGDAHPIGDHLFSTGVIYVIIQPRG